MRSAYRLFGILAVVICAGCATRRPWFSLRPERRARPAPAVPAEAPVSRTNPTFSFVIQSDPPGADVCQVTTGGERLVGKTPLTLSLKLTRQRAKGPLGLLRRGAWQAYVPEGVPIIFRDAGDTFVVRIPELRVRKNGYQPETFVRQWTLPASLTTSVSKWKSAPVPRRYSETIVLGTPTEPQHRTTVTIESASGRAEIHAIDAKGGIGRLVGATPLSAKMGYAAKRSATGEVVDWVRWHEKDQELWSHTKDGDLLLNCILVRDGYEPERLHNRRIFSFQAKEEPQITALFQLVRPTKPEATFKLRVDSLPSVAAVYAVNADGSLGQEIGKTPFDCVIGMAQESVEESPGQYVHKDWRIWAPEGLVRWQNERDGTTVFRLTCAIYKDGFAVENVAQPLFKLKPGMAYPEALTLTIPLPSSEQAAVRESHRLQQARMAAAEQTERRPASIVWQAPPEQPGPSAEAGSEEAPKKRGTRLSRWWRGVWHRE
jgi:hypothetical protein